MIGLALATQQHGGILSAKAARSAALSRIRANYLRRHSARIANSWRETHAGVQNAHKAAVLEEGMKFDKIAITNEEAQFLETRRFQVIDICRLYGVPPHRLGELDKATLNNIEQQNQQYVDSALRPIAELVEELFNHHLLSDDERSILECKFDFDDMTRGDMLTRYQAYQVGTLNEAVRNEARARENMNPIDDGHGDEYRVPLNTAVPSDSLDPATTAPNESAPKPAVTPTKPEPGATDSTQERAIVYFVIAWRLPVDLIVIVARGPLLIDPILKLAIVLLAFAIVLGLSRHGRSLAG